MLGIVTAAILISSAVWMTTITTTALPSAFATVIGGDDDDDNDDDSLAERIIDDVDREIDETLSELPTSPPTGGGGSASCDGQTATIVGTDGPDSIFAPDSNDVIVGLGGDDVIVGQGGNDVICGNDGNDDIQGDFVANRGFQHGNDRVFGGSGDDFFAMQDTVRGNDYADGEAGNNKCTTDPGDIFVNCMNPVAGTTS